MGNLYVVNPKQNISQGIISYRDLNDIPENRSGNTCNLCDLCLSAVEILVRDKIPGIHYYFSRIQ